MSDRQLPQEAKHFIAAKRLIKDESDWCDDASGWYNPRRPLQQFCIEGALQKAMGFASGHGVHYAAFRATKEYKDLCRLAHLHWGMDYPHDVNDRCGHDAALHLLDLAIDAACVNNL